MRMENRCLPDAAMPYPRICAHRGFNTVAPENSLPAYGAAVALGAQEIEFDVWAAKDGVIVSTHDPRLERTSDGTGFVYDHTYAELRQYDFGSKCAEAYRGLRIMTLEQVLSMFGKRAVMNMHVKSPIKGAPLPEAEIREILRLIDAYELREYIYFKTENEALLAQLRELAPDIPRCVGGIEGLDAEGLLALAAKYDCRKIQLFKPHFPDLPEDYLKTVIPRAHAMGIRVNIFWSDDPEETKRYFDMGIDTVLTNDYWRNAQVLLQLHGA